MRKLLLTLILLPTIILADAVIFSGNDVKALKANLNLFDVAKILTTSVDPSSSGLDAPIGSIAMETVTGNTYIKTGSSTVDWVKNQVGPVNLASDVSGILPIANGGTGSSTKNFVDLTTSQSVSGTKSFTNDVVASDYTFSDTNFNTLSSKDIIAGFGGTGVASGGIVSIGTPNTTASISDGYGYVTVNTGGSTSVKKVTWSGLTNFALPFITTNLVTYLAIDDTGAVVQQVSPFTNDQSRDYIVVGAAVHTNLSTVNAVNQLHHVVLSPVDQLTDLQRSLGFFNVSGNIYSPNGANLNLNKSAGVIHKTGSNWDVDQKSPNTRSLSSGTAITFRYRTQTGVEGADVTSVDPSNYDNAGTVTAVPVNKYTIQRINIFSSNLTRIQYGQVLYNTLADALASIQTETFVTESNISQNGLLRGFLIVRHGTTSLTSATDAFFLEASKFGGASGVGGLSTTSLQGAYDNSSTPQITTTTALGSLDIKRGSAADTDYVMKILNGAGSLVTGFKGDGHTTIEGVTSTGATGTGNFVFDTSPTLVTPNLGTPSAAILTNATGLPISTGVSGLATGISTFLTTPSSANLASAVTDETGSGSLVFSTSPALTTPNLGTPSAATLTNATGLPLSTGVTGTLAVASGGTGTSTLTSNNVILGAGTSTVTFVAPGTSGNILTSNGTTWTSAVLGSSTAQVTTPGASGPVLYSAFINTAGTKSKEVGSWLSGNCSYGSPVANRWNCPITSGKFSTPPNCWIQDDNTGAASFRKTWMDQTNYTTTNLVVDQLNAGGISRTSDGAFYIFCHGTP